MFKFLSHIYEYFVVCKSFLFRMAKSLSFGTELSRFKPLIYIPIPLRTCDISSLARVPRGPVVKCLTRNPGVLGSSRTRSSELFRGSVLGKDTSEPSLVLVKPRKDMNNVSCRGDMTEILLKAA